MVVPNKSNLEPIEESDLNLKEKLAGGISEHSFENEVFPAEREIQQEAVASERDSAYANILSKVQTQGVQNPDPGVVASDAHEGMQKTDAESQIQHLVDIAQQKGVLHAVKVAQHMEDYYILDAFHDKMLADELHDALLAKGMLKEI